jgi:hypothetical protein
MIGTPNLFAYAALFGWVGVTVGAFASLRPPLATMLAVIGGVMFLPEHLAVDLPLLPPINKHSLAGFSALVGALWKSRARLLDARPFRGPDALFLLVLLGDVGTSLTNTDPIVTGSIVRSALSLYDAFAGAIKDTLSLYIPFFVARAMLRTSRDLDCFTRFLAGCGLVYGALALIEVRLSPQLHRWVYGYHPTDFSMSMRFGGYRPLVFMQHGLGTALFLLATCIAAWARVRAGRGRVPVPVFLSVVLVLCKSTGALVYAFAVLPLVASLRRPRMRLAGGLALLVLFYPLARGFDLFPVDLLVEQAERISVERALSLGFRFEQERALLDRALERPAFGWGTYDRNRLFDPVTGRDLSITDGDWIIVLGTRGLVGFAGLYGMLGLTVLLAYRRLRRVRGARDRVLLSAVGLLAAIEIVDLLPNGLFSELPYFFVGALGGLSEGIVRVGRRRAVGARAAGRRVDTGDAPDRHAAARSDPTLERGRASRGGARRLARSTT